MVCASCSSTVRGTAPAFVGDSISVTLLLVESQEADVSTKHMLLEQNKDCARLITGVLTTTAHGLSCLMATIVPALKEEIE